MPRLARTALAFAAASGVLLAALPAAAQSSVCQEGQKLLTDRRSLIEKLSSAGGKNKKVDPRPACKMFGDLVANGTATLKWIETNGDWCQIPPQILQNMKADHAKAQEIRGKACQAAAQMAQMEKRAKQMQQQGGGGGGLLGGDGLTGPQRMPQGAL